MVSVYLWWPNLIGYARIVSLGVALFYAMRSPMQAGLCYAVSQLLDAVDGVVARAVNQCSKFGALLDMLTDRMSTTCLLVVIATKDPSRWAFFTFIIVLDLVAHWAQMYSSLMAGIQSHKENTNPILKFYYSFPFLLLFCVGNEAFIIGTYLELFPAALPPAFLTAVRAIKYVCLPVFLGKNFFNVVQLVESSNRLVRLDRPKPH
ncbi:CDP-diacylglycerol--inositol 3-phosphatidyltransferase [Plasmodiophora brassicae]|uniref:CDP-diacylglycerol--inositol 3-phosphatidyltransferase n=1 Tax=Plasmodiophora brassicae TaxID=37360 RepID=A0A0G4IV16_PLABS|nr:hypothetical protein PBRA_007070 [Plasmodiophora brassicae]SPQ95729.1 unnamed protein product [Plasmodiophora brassicae]